jgi:hypothetical protein
VPRNCSCRCWLDATLPLLLTWCYPAAAVAAADVAAQAVLEFKWETFAGGWVRFEFL